MHETPPKNDREDIPSVADMRRSLEGAATAERLQNLRSVVIKAIDRLSGWIADIDKTLCNDVQNPISKNIWRAEREALAEDCEQFKQLLDDFPESSV